MWNSLIIDQPLRDSYTTNKYNKYLKGKKSSETDKYAQYKGDKDKKWRVKISYWHMLTFIISWFILLILWLFLKFLFYPTIVGIKTIVDLPDLLNFLFYTVFLNDYIFLLIGILFFIGFWHAFMYVKYLKVNSKFLEEIDSYTNQ